jgi:hypothetical protein
MAMVPKREPTSAEYQQVLDENDALRAEIVKLKWKLENCEMIRQSKPAISAGCGRTTEESMPNCGTSIGRKSRTPALGRHRSDPSLWLGCHSAGVSPAEPVWKTIKILRVCQKE